MRVERDEEFGLLVAAPGVPEELDVAAVRRGVTVAHERLDRDFTCGFEVLFEGAADEDAHPDSVPDGRVHTAVRVAGGRVPARGVAPDGGLAGRAPVGSRDALAGKAEAAGTVPYGRSGRTGAEGWLGSS
ncbi:hypothetical protein GCM10010430_45380 [Kitasatospora cystarginea]|uniref:Uncharacterized protein n=1 Tax=Kitasatospora cystarginea TaxID=58350 RepID=A0ABN3EFH3_9ACTN